MPSGSGRGEFNYFHLCLVFKVCLQMVIINVLLLMLVLSAVELSLCKCPCLHGAIICCLDWPIDWSALVHVAQLQRGDEVGLNGLQKEVESRADLKRCSV